MTTTKTIMMIITTTKTITNKQKSQKRCSACWGSLVSWSSCLASIKMPWWKMIHVICSRYTPLPEDDRQYLACRWNQTRWFNTRRYLQRYQVPLAGASHNDSLLRPLSCRVLHSLFPEEPREDGRVLPVKCEPTSDYQTCKLSLMEFYFCIFCLNLFLFYYLVAM